MIGLILVLSACGEKEDTATVEPSSEVDTGESNSDVDTGDTDSDVDTEDTDSDVDTDDTDSGVDTDSDVDTGDTEPQRCEILAVDVCGQRPDCIVIQGREMVVDTVNECYNVGAPTDLGCMDAGMMCSDAITFAVDPAGGECTWFNNGCLPYQWEQCEQEFLECP